MTGERDRLASLTAAEWKDDVAFLGSELTKRHRDPYHFIPEERLQGAIAKLLDQIPTMRSVDDIVVGIHRITTAIGDGHTSLVTDQLYRSFPLETFWFGSELRVIRTGPSLSDALGARIVRIGEHPIRRACDLLRPLVQQAENEWFALHKSARLCTFAGPLLVQGILERGKPPEFTFVHDDGRTITLDPGEAMDASLDDWLDVRRTPPPTLQNPREALWYTVLDDASTVYASFYSYRDIESNAADLWRLVDAKHPRRLVLDMRQNGGGNFALGRQHLVYEAGFRPHVNRTGRLFVITGRATFSAAMVNAVDFRRETEAIIVGEPPGARPTGYQELAQFSLPHSGLRVNCSTHFYRFQDGEGTAVLPDKRIDPDWEAYKAGRDPVMEWIREQPSS